MSTTSGAAADGRMLFHATVDVLEIATRYAGGSDQQGVASLLQLSAVSAAWCTAAGNVAAEELVARHCDVDVDEHDDDARFSATYDRVVLDRYFESLGCNPRNNSGPPPLRLRLTYNQWHRCFPAHTALLLAAMRGGGPGHAETLRCIRAISVTAMDFLTEANHRGFEVLLRILDEPGLLRLERLEALRLTGKNDRASSVRTDLLPCPSLLSILDTQFDFSSIVLFTLDAKKFEPVCLPRVLGRLPALRCLCLWGSCSSEDDVDSLAASLTQCPKLEYLSLSLSGALVPDLVTVFAELAPSQFAQLKTLCLVHGTSPSDVIAVFEALVGSVKNLMQASDGPPLLALEDVALLFQRDLADRPAHEDTEPLVRRAYRAFGGLLRMLPALRSCDVPFLLGHSAIARVAAEADDKTYAFETLAFVDDDPDKLRMLLRQLPQLTFVEFPDACKYNEPTLAAIVEALAAFPGKLRKIEFTFCQVAATPRLTQAFTAMLAQHGATLRKLVAPGWLLSTPAIALHCTALGTYVNIDQFRKNPEATSPSARILQLNSLLNDAREAGGNAEDVAKFLDNNGHDRVNARFLGATTDLPRDHRWLLPVAARRCPNIERLTIPGDLNSVAFTYLLRVLPRVRHVAIESEFANLAGLLAVLARPAAPQLESLRLQWWPFGSQQNTDHLRRMLEEFAATSQPHLTLLAEN